VILPLHTQHYHQLQRNLLYTAVTRGRKLVIVIGSRRALALAVERHNPSQRCTALAKRLQ
jgi:exodeoxyribonuclease V alpha subunit